MVDVSVIIPAYNAAATLAEAIDSVVSQTYHGWEIVVVDDGSSDATAEIARSYADRDGRIRLVMQANGGESAARNSGIVHAGYDWLLFLDSDDWIAPEYLAKMTGELTAHPELDAVHCGSVRVTADGTPISDDYEPPAGDLFPVLARRAAFPVHACVVRKSLVEAVGKFDTGLKTCPDWDLWQRIARGGARFGAVREVLAYYRVRPDSASTRAEQLFRDDLTVLKRGHAADSRVPNPVPEYADGLAGDSVESQVFYLLCWGAGLLLGAGKDARVLLDQVREYRFPSLSPDAVAKCILEAGTLPASQGREAWERYFPEAARNVEEFLEALEEQSQTPGLAEAALQQFKRMVLKHSPLWKSVIEEDERENARTGSLAAQVEELSAQHERILNTIQLREEKAVLQQQLAAVQGAGSALRKDLDEARGRESALVLELRDARHGNSIVERELEALRRELEASRERESEVRRQLEVSQQGESALREELETSRERESEVRRQLEVSQQGESALREELETSRERESAVRRQLEVSQQGESALREELERTLKAELVMRRQAEDARLEQTLLSREIEGLAAELEQAEGRAEVLAIEKSAAEEALRRWRDQAWSRLGLKLGIAREHGAAVATPTQEGEAVSFNEAPPDDWKWEFLVGPRSAAQVYAAPGDAETFRVVISRAVTQERHDIQLNRAGIKLDAGCRYTLQFRARSDRPRTIGVGVAKAQPPWSNLGFYRQFLLQPEWQTFQEEFAVETQEDNARIHFDLGGREPAVELADFHVQEPAPAR